MQGMPVKKDEGKKDDDKSKQLTNAAAVAAQAAAAAAAARGPQPPQMGAPRLGGPNPTMMPMQMQVPPGGPRPVATIAHAG
jgi:hypothetical protein